MSLYFLLTGEKLVGLCDNGRMGLPSSVIALPISAILA